MTLVFLDCETTHLDPEKGQVWEIAYAVDDGPLQRSFVEHTLNGADPQALVVGRYRERHVRTDAINSIGFEIGVRALLEGATLVGANPAFDAAFLKKRWNEAPWHYRLLDVCAYTAGALGLDYVPGLAECAKLLGIDALPDHTAAQDVAVTREAYRAAKNYERG